MPSILEYLEFSQLAYDLTSASGTPTVPIPSGWTVLPNPPIDPNGLTAVAFMNSTTKQIVLAFRGSVTAHDWGTADAKGIALGVRPTQFNAAEAYAQALETNNPGYTLLVTGHSLGADEAEDVAATLNVGGATFAAPDVTNLLPAGASSSVPGLIDYNILTDPVAQGAVLSGSHVGTVVTLPPVDYLSGILLGGALGGVAGAIGVSALLQHPLYSYGQSLVHAGLITSNPITQPAYIFGDLDEIYNNVVNLVVGSDASGDVTQSGTVIASGGTAEISETLTTVGTTNFTLQATTSEGMVSQSATISAAGTVVSDQVILNGTTVDSSPSDPVDVNLDVNGSIIVGTASSQPGDEVTLAENPDGTDTLTYGGDTSGTSQQIVNFGTDGLTGDTLVIADPTPSTVDLTTEIESGDTAVVTADMNLSPVTQDFEFLGSAGNLKLEDPSSFFGTIKSFVSGDTIDLAAIGTATSATLGTGNVLTVSGAAGGTINLQLDPTQNYTGKTFKVASDGNGGTNVTFGGKTSDLAFVFDTTGSMDPYIAAVQTGATAILNDEFSTYATADVAVISFKDPQAGYPDQVIQSFTSDQTALQNAINSLTAEGGGDIPEGDYSGLLLALNGSAGAWDTDPGVERQIILYTDAPVKDTDLAAQVNEYAHDLNTVVNTMTVSASATSAMSVVDPSGAPEQTDTFTFATTAAGTTPAPVQIDTIQVGDDPTATASVQQIATDNGGVFLQAPTADQLTKAIISDINNPGTTTANFTVTDVTNGQTTTAAGQAYSGPVTGLTSEFILPTTDQVTVTSGIPNVFIQVGVQGQPNPTIAGIDVSKGNGNNVLDSYANSSFLTDGTGTDQNYLDARALTQNEWDTVVNFHSGDNITLWGVTQADFNLDWIGDTQGATGFTGLTGVFVPTTPSQPDAGVTLAGFKLADLTNGKLAITYDTINGTPYASIHAT